MDFVLENVGKWQKFWDLMPETYQGFGYEVEGDWDYDAEKFHPKWFQLYDEEQVLRLGYCPADLLQYVERACKEIAADLEAKGLIGDALIEEDEYTYEDYLADKADKEYYERN